MTEIHFELLVGKRVHDVNGKVVGALRNGQAVRRANQYWVEWWEVGTAALFESLGISIARLVGIRVREPLRIPWQQLDLSDPEKPRLKCTKEELLALQKDR